MYLKRIFFCLISIILKILYHIYFFIEKKSKPNVNGILSCAIKVKSSKGKKLHIKSEFLQTLGTIQQQPIAFLLTDIM